MREFFTIAIFKIKADIRMNKTALNSQKEKHSMLSLRRATGRHTRQKDPQFISIHALLAESDCWPRPTIWTSAQFLSTLSLRRATTGVRGVSCRKDDFYPRSPCGERPMTAVSGRLSAYFYPRSPCGERPWKIRSMATSGDLFLSTLSLRRATGCPWRPYQCR